MELTEQQAKEIIEAFGPCTTVFECFSPKDLAAEFKGAEIPYTSVQDFVRDLLNIEDVYFDRSADAAYEKEAGDGPKGHHQKVIEEQKNMRADIVRRLRDKDLLPN